MVKYDRATEKKMEKWTETRMEGQICPTIRWEKPKEEQNDDRPGSGARWNVTVWWIPLVR